MGFEYKIVARFTEKQLKDIYDLLAQNKYFGKKHCFDGKDFWDFRRPENHGQMPNVSIVFEPDGIYICRYSSSYLWQDLDTLKTYIEAQNIEHKILDYG